MRGDGDERMLTPRAAGIALVAASVVLAVVSVFHLTSAAWGLIAAAGLSVALAAGGLGVVWMSRTTWGAEPPPKRQDPDAPFDPRRARRSALVYGIVSLVLGAGGLVASIALAFRPESARIVMVAVVTIVLGIALVRFARSPVGASDDADALDDDAVPDAADADAGGWQRLSRRDGFVLATYSMPGLLFAVWFLFQLAPLSAVPSSDWVGSAVVAVVVVVAVLGGVTAWVLRRFPEVWVNPSARRIRVGAQEADWHDLTAAKVSEASMWTGAPRTIFLTLETKAGLRAPLTLRRRDRLGLTKAQRDLAVRMITESRVEMPRADEDPEGRFSRFNFPSHVGRDDALALVANPPRGGERLPIAYN